MCVRRGSVRICACAVQTDRRQRDGEAATSCASSQIAQSLTNWVERMRRTQLSLADLTKNLSEKTRKGDKQYLCLNEGGGRVYACSPVALLLHLYLTLTEKMEDSIAKLKHFTYLCLTCLQ